MPAPSGLIAHFPYALMAFISGVDSEAFFILILEWLGRRAISVPLTLVIRDTSRSLMARPLPGLATASRPITAICKQRVRGSSPLSSTRQNSQ